MPVSWSKTYPGGINPNDPATAVTDVWGDNVDTGIQQLYQLPNAKGDLPVATAADTWERLGSGSNDQVLVADSAQATGLKWAAVPTGGLVLLSAIDAKGDLLAGTAADTVGRLAVGSNGQFLKAASGETTGLQWETLDDADIAFADWTLYTPAWTSTGTAPALGNGTATGAYVKLGRTLIGWFQIVLGSTSTVGTGNYRFSLPFSLSWPGSGNVPLGVGKFIDNSASIYLGHLAHEGTNTVSITVQTTNPTTYATLGAAAPVVPASTDHFHGWFATRTSS